MKILFSLRMHKCKTDTFSQYCVVFCSHTKSTMSRTFVYNVRGTTLQMQGCEIRYRIFNLHIVILI